MTPLSKVTTKDGSTSFFNTEFNECYHSYIGAYTEALEKHVRPCKIEELALQLKNSNARTVKNCKKTKLKLLDVCFGLGYNSGVAIEKALAVNPDLEIEVVGLENDTQILKHISELEVPESYQSIKNELAKLYTSQSDHESTMLFRQTVQQAVQQIASTAEYKTTSDLQSKERCMVINDINYLQIENENFTVKILIGDARECIKELVDNYFDAVFFDAFSPKVCPELWTPEFIRDVVTKTKPGAYISTYSSSRIAKDNFKAAGCEIFEGPKLHRRSGGVVAHKVT